MTALDALGVLAVALIGGAVGIAFFYLQYQTYKALRDEDHPDHEKATGAWESSQQHERDRFRFP